LVLAAPDLDPGPVLRQTLPLLAPSAPFAAWFPAAQPLAEALHALRSAGAAVNLSMHEPWLRKHQVLPGRTHPTMTTDAGAGGFVLSGNRVLTKEEEERAERAAMQAKARREKEDVHRTRLESAEGGAEEAEEEDARGPESAEEEDARGPESAEAAAKRADTRKRARDEDRGAGEAPAGEEQKADRPEGPARRASTRSKTR
jgi:hypothetical protein